MPGRLHSIVINRICVQYMFTESERCEYIVDPRNTFMRAKSNLNIRFLPHLKSKFEIELNLDQLRFKIDHITIQSHCQNKPEC